MKRIYTILVAVLLTATVWAQAPQKMSYQSVVRDASNNLVTNTQVGLQVRILQGSATGTEVYTETQTPTTNANGLLTVEIGGQAGFDTISWANGPYFIETSIDPTGGTNYTITGTSQLLSVPYALHAKTAETITSGMNETDPVFTAWNKDYSDLINKPNIIDSISIVIDTTTQFIRAEIDGDTTNEIQNLSISGNDLSISNGNTVTLPSTGSLWTENSGDIYRNSGNVGIGLANPTEKLHIIGNTSYAGTNIITDGNDRPSIFLTGSFPNIILGSNGNADHGSTIGFWNYDGTANTYQWNMGGGQQGTFSIGYTKNSSDPHCGINGYTSSCPNAITPFLIDTTGYIGFGKINPEAYLDINVKQGDGILHNIINFSGTSGGTADIASFQYDDGTNPYPLILNMNPQNDYSRAFVITGGNVGIGLTNPKSKLQVNGGIQIANDTDVASADKVGSIRYRSDSNNSYVEMCMQTGTNTYAWVIIKQNTW